MPYQLVYELTRKRSPQWDHPLPLSALEAVLVLQLISDLAVIVSFVLACIGFGWSFVLISIVARIAFMALFYTLLAAMWVFTFGHEIDD